MKIFTCPVYRRFVKESLSISILQTFRSCLSYTDILLEGWNEGREKKTLFSDFVTKCFLRISREVQGSSTTSFPHYPRPPQNWWFFAGTEDATLLAYWLHLLSRFRPFILRRLWEALNLLLGWSEITNEVKEKSRRMDCERKDLALVSIYPNIQMCVPLKMYYSKFWGRGRFS